MSSTNADIVHVSDTALMVAACRALETARTDGLVRDPFAEELAGERGMAIARGLPRLEIMCFGVGIRSRFLDELVLDAIQARGVETVLCLGAGLDTRPWRLALPARVRWIEVDFPAMLDYKASVMDRHTPKCRVERVAADLSSAPERSALFARAGTAPALVITEGLLTYLPSETIQALAAEGSRTAAVRHWLLDLASPVFEQNVRMDAFDSVQKMRADDHLDGLQILDILNRNGFRTVRKRTYTMDALAAAMSRILALAASRPASDPQVPRPPMDDPSGVHLLGKG